jgi:hypothetical protein
MEFGNGAAREVKPSKSVRAVVRHRQFPHELGLNTIMRVLEQERFTGVLQVHFGQGAVNAVSAEDSKKLRET